MSAFEMAREEFLAWARRFPDRAAGLEGWLRMNRVRDDVWSYGPGTCFLPQVGPRAYVFLRERRTGFLYAQHGLAGWANVPRDEQWGGNVSRCPAEIVGERDVEDFNEGGRS